MRRAKTQTSRVTKKSGTFKPCGCDGGRIRGTSLPHAACNGTGMRPA